MLELKKFLLDHPEVASSIVSGGINFSGDDLMRVLSAYTKDGFSINACVDDDKLTEQELFKHHEELANQALKVIYLHLNEK